VCVVLLFFFFSSRRRHTSFSRDWSSDVCSSDLGDAWGRFASNATNRPNLRSDPMRPLPPNLQNSRTNRRRYSCYSVQLPLTLLFTMTKSNSHFADSSTFDGEPPEQECAGGSGSSERRPGGPE